VNDTWYPQFLRTVRRADLADPLREAALAGRLTGWTRTLTDAVAATCAELGWRAVSKGHPADFMPAVGRRLHQEYLALDVVAFTEADTRQPDDGFRWPFPVAVFELENKAQAERIAFSLWKVLMARAQVRVVFCYCKERDEIGNLVRTIGGAVIPGLSAADRAAVAPSLMLVVGTRDKAEAFPYGFFHEWILGGQTGAFKKG